DAANILALSFHESCRHVPYMFGILNRRATVLLHDQTHDKRRDSKLKSDRAPHIVDLGRDWFKVANLALNRIGIFQSMAGYGANDLGALAKFLRPIKQPGD